MSHSVEAVLRHAGRERRRVRATYQFEGEHGVKHCERHWEPYAVTQGNVLVYSYFQDEFRRIPLADIVHVELCDGNFHPRRPIEL